jgi:PAS domain-containing protein
VTFYANWPHKRFDERQFNGGRVFERYPKVKFVEGGNVGRVWSFSDITERKRAEAYTAQLAAIVESSNDGIVVSDLNGIITSWNTGAERIFGYPASEIIGSSIGSSICRLRPRPARKKRTTSRISRVENL